MLCIPHMIALLTFEKWLPVGVHLPLDSYLFYVCFGGAAARFGLNRRISYLLYTAALLAAGWILLFTDGEVLNIRHLAVCCMAMGVFAVFSPLSVRPGRLLLCLSVCTWGIYLIHPLYINVAAKLFSLDLISSAPALKLSVFAVILFGISFASVYVLRRIPLVRRLF